MDKLKVWMIPQDCLEMSTPLGQGQFGKVFLAHLKMKSGNHKKVAVKTIKGNINSNFTELGALTIPDSETFNTSDLDTSHP